MSNYTKKSVSIPQAVWIACNFIRRMECARLTRFQYRKRYGLHAMTTPKWRMTTISKFQYRKRYGLHAIEARLTLESLSIGFNTASGMDCMQYARQHEFCGGDGVSIPQAVWIACNSAGYLTGGNSASFNTASGMDCMQYRPSQPLGQLNPEAGFLNGALFLANRRKLAGFFCHQNRLKTSVNPVISRKLLSTEKA